MKKSVLTVLLWLFVAGACTCSALAKEQLTIAWFSELSPEHSYWKSNFAFAKAVADDLGVTLRPYYVRSDQFRYKKLLQQTASATDGEPAVDGIVFLNIKQQDGALLELLEAGKVPGISNVLAMDYQLVGMPRQRYKRWLGEIIDDESANGYTLAEQLINAAREKDLYAADGNIHLVALHGPLADSAGARRAEGLVNYLKTQPDVVYHQGFHSDHWSREEGRLFSITALRRYPDTSVVWSANDDMLLGALDGAAQLGRQPGTDLVTGAIDGTVQVIKKVMAGDVVCTIGGLTMHSGWAVLLLHDYLRGRDFVDDTGVIIKNRNVVINSSNAEKYLDKFGSDDWSDVDFRRFSKVLNAELAQYQFSAQAAIEQK